MSEVSQDDRTMAMLAHLTTLVWIGPLVIWLMNKDKPDKGFVIENAKEALNFLISLWILGIGLVVITTVLAFIPFLGWIAGIFLWLIMMAIGVAALVLIIMAAMKANEGISYKYPNPLRLIK